MTPDLEIDKFVELLHLVYSMRAVRERQYDIGWGVYHIGKMGCKFFYEALTYGDD